jgi:ferredoxin
MSYDKQIAQIRACCKELLEQGKVDIVLGYTSGGLDGLLTPFFARKPEDTDKLEWGDRCFHNLACYLHGRTDRVGIVAKPCDVRAVVQYIVEQQIKRESVYIIGVDCCAMVDAEGKTRPGCADCVVRVPPIFDTHVVDERAATQNKVAASGDEENLAKNLEKFQREIDKCILCYSCRQACYGCYCQVCFMDRGAPNWLPSEVDASTKMTFHLGRSMHLAGRCVECGGCESACASGVNIRYIIKEITKFLEDTYDYRAGMDLDTTSCMVVYKEEDKEIGFLGGGNDE